LIAARIGKRFCAPMLFDGTCNTRIFNAWLEEMLCPLLEPGMVVIMDNAAFHKSAATRKLIRKTGARLLFLPPYSPDLNPIVQTFATLKRARQTYPQHDLDTIVALYDN
jgi:putative transposase